VFLSDAEAPYFFSVSICGLVSSMNLLKLNPLYFLSYFRTLSFPKTEARLRMMLRKKDI
jgi:hypothetical protein